MSRVDHSNIRVGSSVVLLPAQNRSAEFREEGELRV